MLTRPQLHDAEATTHEAEATTHEAEAEAKTTTHEAEAKIHLEILIISFHFIYYFINQHIHLTTILL